MAKIRVIKKNDDYSMDYQVGDILEVTGTWYGGINVNSKTGIPLCLDKDEYEEIPENTDLSHEEYERAANYWKEKDAQSKKLDQDALKKGVTDCIDSCTMMQSYGRDLHLVTGSDENIKITTPEDFYTMRALLEAKENAQIYSFESR